MAAGIFGALGALGSAGNQIAEGQQLAHEEILRRLAAHQQQETQKLAQESTRQRILKTQQELEAGRQPIPLGPSYISGGKTYQRFQDPITGKVTMQELPGGTPETEQEKIHRGLLAIGVSEEEASNAVVRKLTGRSAEKREIQPDPTSPTGFAAVYFDTDGNEVWRTATVPARTLLPRKTTRTSQDPYGNVSTSTSITAPMFPGAGNLGGAISRLPGGQAPAGGAGGASVPSSTPETQGGPAAARGGDGIVSNLASANIPAATRKKTPPGPPPAPVTPPVSVGTYRGIQLAPDGTGQIPPRPGLNDQVRQFAEDILNGRDTNKIPVKARALAESVARQYGWKGQGSLTPAQQMQIEQVDNSLAAISDPKLLKVFDGPSSLAMAAVPLDPTGEGGFAGVSAAIKRKMMNTQQTEYMNALTRLRGIIGGIRGFTGANNSNATADRLLAELPNFTNTKNSADAQNKILRLRQEVQIIKRLGYFLPADPNSNLQQNAATSTPAPSNAESEADRLLRENGVIQ